MLSKIVKYAIVLVFSNELTIIVSCFYLMIDYRRKFLNLKYDKFIPVI